MKSPAFQILTPLSDELKKSMNSPADNIIWRIFDDEIKVSQLTQEEKNIIKEEYGDDWVHTLGVSLIKSQL